MLWCEFWKIQKFFEILPLSDWRLFALNQVDFLAQCACGKALCKFDQPTSLRTSFEKSWTLKNINFLKSSPRRAEGQILEKTPCKPTTVYFTTLTAWLVPTDSVCQVWCQLVLYLLRNWLKQTAQEGAQEGEFYEVWWDCLNTLFKEWGQIAAHYHNQCKFIVLLPKKRAWELFAGCRNLSWHVKNTAYWNTVIPNVCTVLKLHLVISAQISYSSLVPQLTWDCVVNFEADPAFLALALATWVFLKRIWKTQKISEKPLTCDWNLIPQFWTHFLGQCINLEVLYTFQHATTPGTNFDSSWTGIFIVSVQGSTKTKTRKVGKKSFLRVRNP